MRSIYSTLFIVCLLSAVPLFLVGSDRSAWAQTETDERQAEADRLLQQCREQLQANQFEAALQSCQQSADRFAEIGDRSKQGRSITNLGIAYAGLGQHQQAIEQYQLALPLVKEAGDREAESIALVQLITSYGALNQYDQAIESTQQLLTLARETHNRPQEGAALAILSIAYVETGAYQQAIEPGQQALPLLQAANNQTAEIQLLNSLSWAYQNLSQYQEALDAAQRALPLAQAAENRSGEAYALNNLGLAYQSLSQYQQAIEQYQQALPIFQAVGDRNGEALAVMNLGNAYQSLSQYQQAIEQYQLALPIFQAVGDRDSEGKLLANLGKLLSGQDQPELAIVFLKQSVNVRETIRGSLRGLSIDLQQSYTDSVANDYRKLADLLLQQNRVLEAQRILDLLKVQELDDYLQDVQRSGKTESGVEYWRPEQRILELYKTAIIDGIELAQLEEKAKITPLTPAEQARFNELNARQGELLDSFYDFIDIPEVQTAIQQLQQTTNSQNIELEQLQALQSNLRDLNQNAVLLYPLILDDRLELVLVTPNSPPIRRPVDISATDLNRLIVSMGQALKHSNSNIKPIAQQLYQKLIQPIEADLKAADAKTLIYSPDGALRYIPLGALYDGNQWLAQRFAITNITAASLINFDTQPSYQQNALKILAAACVQCDFNFEVGDRAFNFDNLTAAGTEVENLAAAIPGTETRINQAFNLDMIPLMRQFSIVHLATHAAFVQGQPEESFIVLGSGDRVTTREIRRWNITNTDLVVLSACETAVGEAELGSGIEILGFGYQMQRAGAKSAIASLWPVSDGGTQVLMNAFYAALNSGMTKAAALQAAQTALITGNFSTIPGVRGDILVTSTGTGRSIDNNPLDHPYYWAPFILIGNGL